jgi:hypothetical protein
MDRQAAWRELERALTSLVSSLSSQLNGKDRELLTDFIGNREYGIALEWLYSIVVERKLQLSAPQQHEVRRLADLMEIDLASAVTTSPRPQ